MTMLTEESGRHPWRYIGKGRKPTTKEIREADAAMKRLEKYLGKPISVQ